MGDKFPEARLPRRAETAPPARRPLLAPALLISASAHLAVAAMLWLEQPPQPEPGAAVAVEIVSAPGIAAATGTRPASHPGGHPTPARRPATAPQPRPPAVPAPPRASDEPPPAEPAAPPPLAQPQTAPATVAAATETTVALPRPSSAPPPPRRAPTLAKPPPNTVAKQPAPPAPGNPSAADRPQTASVPIVAADAAPGAGPQPGSGQDEGTTRPRYGFGSAANPIPRYPETARERGWEGLVVLAVAVGADGRAEAVAVRKSSGHAILDQAALEVVRRWRFEPARRAGVPVAAGVDVPIRFRLED